MTPADQLLLDSLSDAAIVGLTLYGEARGLSDEGLAGVACAIRNRVTAKRFGKGYRGVCLRPAAFSCWRGTAGPGEVANHASVMDAAGAISRGKSGPTLDRCLAMAVRIMEGELPDKTLGSTHYITEKLWRTDPPTWAIGKTPMCQIDQHVFFAGIA